MSAPDPRPVLVAVDGSAAADQALAWAAAEAHRGRRPLVIMTVYPWPVTGSPDTVEVGARLRMALRVRAEEVAERARRAVALPGLSVRVEVLEGDVVGLLREASGAAELLVLGSRGLGGFTGMLLGSTTVALAAHGRCPVVVVRHAADRGGLGPVVVGVECGGSDERALTYAFDHAAATGAAVVAAHAWSDTAIEAAVADGHVAVDWALWSREAERELATRLAPWRAEFPDVEVRPVVARTRPVDLLLDQAAGAALLVVGSRGRGGFAGLLLGSTSQAVIRHAPCPVVVVRPDER
ncbi:universal stress protein [Actinokineospora auranticolor]|uniref:Nucleotide-binding universal stress UspA family protein n=1 Tax=Actinokineospora auranticolor TaxID=155976 RepID=A0A2S6GPQ3_9PSEU|nr:universal stress protein [Actinokineospora auranticolor]PPK67235.1 nucleotide-binding universal stress UspA family protein [Actinokineospora auranticolor]